MSDSEEEDNIYDLIEIKYDNNYDHLLTIDPEYTEKPYNIFDNLYDNLSFLTLSKLSITNKFFYCHINNYLKNDITIKNKILYSYIHILYDTKYYNKYIRYNIIIDHYISNKYNHNLFNEIEYDTLKMKINKWSKQIRINNLNYKDKNICFINRKKNNISKIRCSNIRYKNWFNIISKIL
jgi:hypothetical protein